MKKYLITYGNQAYTTSKNRLLKEAQALNRFDKIITYSPEHLSEKIKNSSLYQNYANGKGGGYWIWKSYIIQKTLQQMNDNDILVYVDAGCSLYQTKQWKQYFDYLKNYDMLTFRINCINEQYIKKSVVEVFNPINGHYWTKCYMIASGIIFLKKTKFTVDFVNEWMNNGTPKMLFDVLPQERKEQISAFIDHRHDQALFTALLYKYKPIGKIKVIWNDFEAKHKGQAIYASRISDKGIRSSNRENKIKMIVRKYIVLHLRSLRQFFWETLNKQQK